LGLIFKKLATVSLAAVLLASAASAKGPAEADKAALSRIIGRIYQAYTLPVVEAPDDGSYAPENPAGAAIGGYKPTLTPRLEDLIERWDGLMGQTEELYSLNSFDWYCQCQDNDSSTARLVSKSFRVISRNRIDVTVLYSPGRFEGKDTGAPLVFRFRRQKSVWKLDDLTFEDSTTLRNGLADDIRDATKDLAQKMPD
jgi:hypothetical protein